MKSKMRGLAICMAVAILTTSMPVYAAPRQNYSYSKNFFQKNWWDNFWDKVLGKDNNQEENEEKVEVENNSSTVDLTVMEDRSTVDNGDMLRASTYAMTPKASTRAVLPVLKYFPVTMYNYEESIINGATHRKELEAGVQTEWKGIYFNTGTPGASAYSEINIPKGQYYLVSARAQANGANAYLKGKEVSGVHDITSTTKKYATVWTISENPDGTFYIQNGTKYLGIKSGESLFTTTQHKIEIQPYTGDTYTNAIVLKQDSQYLNHFSGGKSTNYGGYSVSNDTGNAFYLFDSNHNQVNIGTLSATMEFADWNHWRKEKNSSNNTKGQYIYSGLVEETLTSDRTKAIKFTKPDGGIFNADYSVKKIYENVDMPFTYDSNTKMYEFDAAKNGVYFKVDPDQKSTEAQHNGRLFFDAEGPQSASGVNAADGGRMWMPFVGKNSMTASECDYHFGMRATIPFSMTTNGRIYETDDTSDPITFEFSGDDDVWVFIDGQLVLDIGGIHNRLTAKIDFANNTWEILDTQDANPNTTRDTLKGSVFNTATSSDGILNQTRESFAAGASHELTIFYLERGKGSSNCKINFNLPMKDYVTVTKRMDKSKTKDNQISAMTSEEKSKYAFTPFEFTLTKDENPVANTKYHLVNRNGQIIDTRSTDASGSFTLFPGQSARFVGEIPSTGSTYKVVEKPVKALGCTLPEYTYVGSAANGYDVLSTHYTKGEDIPKTSPDNDANLLSASVTVKGSLEAEDSLGIICENYLDATLPNPSCLPVDDEIVIDYGLPVHVDVLKNDVWKGESRELIGVTQGQYGTASIDENGRIKYQLTKPLTGVEVLTYTVKVTGTGNVGTETTTATAEGTGKLYIMPATTMYYEEDFNGLVSTTKGTWEVRGTAETDSQETGFVGELNDSPYGSDRAYLKDSHDSNGTSKYVSTKNSAAQFQYTFTGAGTTFFARTTNNSACMKIVITDETGVKVHESIRNTEYTTTDNTLTMYNIPVFTWNAEENGYGYGTYKVTVSLANKALAPAYGSDFWLDGIRIYKPMDTTNTNDPNVQRVLKAYGTDGEDNCTVVTLREKLIAEAMIDTGTGELQWSEQDQLANRFVVFTDTNGKIVNASDYVSYGPKEELYLDVEQNVYFALDQWDKNQYDLYLGMKAPKGLAKVLINNHEVVLNNATDCYYKISDYVDVSGGIGKVNIKAVSGLVSITNIRATGSPQFILIPSPDINVDENISGDI